MEMLRNRVIVIDQFESKWLKDRYLECASKAILAGVNLNKNIYRYRANKKRNVEFLYYVPEKIVFIDYGEGQTVFLNKGISCFVREELAKYEQA